MKSTTPPILAWTGFGLIAAAAILSAALAVELRQAADQRFTAIAGLEEIETMATEQSGRMWKGLTHLLAEEQHAFIRLRGEEQRARGALMQRLEELPLTSADDVSREALENALHGFLGGVQGAFGQMTLAPTRLRQRLRYWDADLGNLRQSLADARASQRTLATDKTKAAATATWAAIVTMLLLMAGVVWRLLAAQRLRRREREALQAQLKHQALHDPLTGLPNRRKFRQRYDEVDTADGAVLFLDLDGFKRVNDSFGHAVGDVLLVETARRLGSCLTSEDVLARQGGDEFLVLLTDSEGAPRVAEQMLRLLQPPFTLQEQEIFVSASIGIVTELEGLDSETAARCADVAMYCAKRGGKNRAVTFAEDMLGDAPERLQLDADFRRALERGEFHVHYQPKVHLASKKTESLEALVRWQHPTKGMVGPDVFIPFAEETGLIADLGRLILDQACRDAVAWQEHGVVVAVNLSPIQFQNPNLVEEVRTALASSGLDPAHLELEITESAVLGDVAATCKILDRLKELGVRLAIDDFGTGYSNLSHLKHFKVDVLKIDQSFIRGEQGSEQLSDRAIVEAVIAMAKAFELDVVAEGVETVRHADELHDLGADLGQGYYFSKPVDAAAITALLRTAEPQTR